MREREQGYCRKGDCRQNALETLDERDFRDATTERDGMKVEEREQDEWNSRLRGMYECRFSNSHYRMRCNGPGMARFQVGIRAIGHNLNLPAAFGSEPIQPIQPIPIS